MPEQTCALLISFQDNETVAQLNVRYIISRNLDLEFFCIVQLLQSFELSCLLILLLQFPAFEKLISFLAALIFVLGALFIFSRYLACFWYLQDMQSDGTLIANKPSCVSHCITGLSCTPLLEAEITNIPETSLFFHS
jgi:hypothetical protein